jgi:hypothetical protein
VNEEGRENTRSVQESQPVSFLHTGKTVQTYGEKLRVNYRCVREEKTYHRNAGVGSGGLPGLTMPPIS